MAAEGGSTYLLNLDEDVLALVFHSLLARCTTDDEAAANLARAQQAAQALRQLTPRVETSRTAYARNVGRVRHAVTCQLRKGAGWPHTLKECGVMVADPMAALCGAFEATLLHAHGSPGSSTEAEHWAIALTALETDRIGNPSQPARSFLRGLLPRQTAGEDIASELQRHLLCVRNRLYTDELAAIPEPESGVTSGHASRSWQRLLIFVDLLLAAWPHADSRDVLLVMSQAEVTTEMAMAALTRCDGDIVDAIMELTS